MSNSRGTMDAIILAGGMGTRLRSLITDVPKPLALVKGRPFLDILLEQLNRSGKIRKVVLAIGYKADQIVNAYCKDNRYSYNIDFAFEHVPLGTGGGIKNAMSHTTSSNVLIMNGDSFIDFELSELQTLHEEHLADISLLVTEVPDVGRYSAVHVDPATSRIMRISEKGAAEGSGLINAGCYLIERSLINQIPSAQNVSFEDQILPLLLSNAYAQVVKKKFIDIGLPETYMIANSDDFWNQ